VRKTRREGETGPEVCTEGEENWGGVGKRKTATKKTENEKKKMATRTAKSRKNDELPKEPGPRDRKRQLVAGWGEGKDKKVT